VIVSAAQARAIDRGELRQVREPVRFRGKLKQPCRFRVGHSYPYTVGGVTQGHVLVLEVDEQAHGEIDMLGAIAAGYRPVTAATVDRYRCDHVDRVDAEWCRIADRIVDSPGRPIPEVADELGVSRLVVHSRVKQLIAAGVWTEGEEVVPEAAKVAARLYRWNRIHAHRLVHVVTFEQDADAPRLLAAEPGSLAVQADYVTDPDLAMPGSMDAGEALTVEEQIACTADRREAAEVRVEAETRRVTARISVAIGELEARDDIGQVATQRLKRMRRDLERIEAEVAATWSASRQRWPRPVR